MAQGKKYSGDLYGRPYGSTMGFSNMGNVSELTTSKEIESEELPSTGRDDYGEAISIDSTPGATEMAVKFNTFDKQGMARALMGEAVDLDTVPITITAEPLTVTTGWIKLAHRDIDPDTFVLSDTEVAPNVIEATQYELNPRLGMIRFNETGTPAVDAELTYSGTTRGTAGYQIDANTLSTLPLEMYLDGKDRITGKDGILEIPHAVMTSDGEINWMSDDWWESGLSGKLVKDTGKPTMRFIEYK
jgi:hypothetical protein